MNSPTCSGRISRISAGLLAASVVSALPAQTPAPSDASHAPTATDSSVITLSKLQVGSEKTNGYRATNSIPATGSGVESYPRDRRDAVRYLPGILTRPSNEAAFTIPGLSGNMVYRNGFYRQQNSAARDRARVEVIMGPTAIYFGAVRPGRFY